MAIERLILEKIHQAQASGQLTQAGLAQVLLGEYTQLRARGFEDIPIERQVDGIPQAPIDRSLEEESAVPQRISVLDGLKLPDVTVLGLPGEEKLTPAPSALLEYVVCRFTTDPESFISIDDMRATMDEHGYKGTVDTVRQHLYAVRNLMRKDPKKRFDIHSHSGKGYRMVRLSDRR